MSLVIELSPDVEKRLVEESRRKGVDAADLVREVIESAFPDQRARNQRAIELLQELREHGDGKEQRETLEALKEGLNASHSSNREIFP
jgi:predicted DNA-binding protein